MFAFNPKGTWHAGAPQRGRDSWREIYNIDQECRVSLGMIFGMATFQGLSGGREASLKTSYKWVMEPFRGTSTQGLRIDRVFQFGIWGIVSAEWAREGVEADV